MSLTPYFRHSCGFRSASRWIHLSHSGKYREARIFASCVTPDVWIRVDGPMAPVITTVNKAMARTAVPFHPNRARCVADSFHHAYDMDIVETGKRGEREPGGSDARMLSPAKPVGNVSSRLCAMRLKCAQVHMAVIMGACVCTVSW